MDGRILDQAVKLRLVLSDLNRISDQCNYCRVVRAHPDKLPKVDMLLN